MNIIAQPGMFGQDIEAWSHDFIRPRLAKIALRELPPPHDLRPECRAWQGRELLVHYPRVMEEDGHSLYGGRVTWDLVWTDELPPMMYLCGDDLEWIEA